MSENKSIKELAREVLDVQNASNLSGCVHTFSRAITRLREIAREEGWESTSKINQHPICIMWSIDILQTINGLDSFCEPIMSYRAKHKMFCLHNYYNREIILKKKNEKI